MPRSRRVVSDDGDLFARFGMHWLNNEFVAKPSDGYVIRDTPFSLFLGGTTPIDRIVYWWNGVISFATPQTDPQLFAAQVAFMANLTRATDLSLFPGDFLSTGFPKNSDERHIVFGLSDFDKQNGIYQFGDAVPVFVTGWGLNDQVMFTENDFSIYAPQKDILGRIGGVDLGPYSIADKAPAIFHFSDFHLVSGFDTADMIAGSAAPDTISGMAGNDILGGGAGGDALYGGAGRDTLSGGDGDDRLFGEASADTLYGNSGNDLLLGGAGADSLTGGGGRDDLQGGGGNDTLLAGNGVEDAPDLVLAQSLTYFGPPFDTDPLFEKNLTGLFDLAADSKIQNATTIYHATVDGTAPLLLTDFTQLTHWFSFDVASAGSTGTFDIDTTKGFDSYIQIFDAAGNLIASQNDGGVLDPGSSSTLDSFLTLNFAAAGKYFIGVSAAQTIAGEPYDPELDTSYVLNISLSDPLRPGSTLNGGTGDDVLVGGNADDLLQGGRGVDTVDFARAANAVSASLVTGHATGAGVDMLVGIENLSGSRLADHLTGDAQANVLRGNTGDDELIGGGGADVLIGGTGLDRFIFAAAPGAGTNCTVGDFAHGKDIFVLDRTFLTELGADGVLADAAFRLGASALAPTDRILFDQPTGTIFYDGDGDGAAAAIAIFFVTPGMTLTATDFVIAG